MREDDISIEKMLGKHIDEVSEIEQICFSQPWSKEGIAAELDNKNAVFFVTCIKEKVVGYAGMYNVCSCGYITNVAVLPGFRKRGVATKLIDSLICYGEINCLEFISLEVRKTNVGAINLYEKKGFEKAGVRKNFYSKPSEDAVIMTKFFKEKVGQKGENNENTCDRKFMR